MNKLPEHITIERVPSVLGEIPIHPVDGCMELKIEIDVMTQSEEECVAIIPIFREQGEPK